MRIGRTPADPAARFFAKVREDGDCWVWVGTKNCGYGHFWHGTGRVYAHRWSFEHFRAPIPDGLQIDHLCRNRACVNPDHLEPVPASVNTRRGTSPAAANAVKDRCKRGHVYDEDNTLTVKGGRWCRTCSREKDARARARRKAAR